MYYKIINKEWKHNGYQYVPGLNVLREEFNDNPNDSCCKGGFYFTTIDHILKFLNYGCYLVEVTLPTSDGDFKMVSDPRGDKFRSNKIILGNKYNLADVTTFQMIIELGAKIDTNDVLQWASENGHLDVVKFFVEKKAYVHADYDFSLRSASANRHFEVVKFLVEKGADIHADDDYPLRSASENGHLEVAKFLVDKGADVHARNDYALRKASKNGHLEVVKFLVEKGANIHAADDYALRYAKINY